MTNATLQKLLDGFILSLAAYLTHQTIFVWFLEFNVFGGSPQLQLGLCVLAIALVFFRLRLGQEERAYFAAWRDNWLLILFLALAFASMGWSVSLPASLYRGLLAFFVSVIAAYAGLRFSARHLLGYLALVMAVFALSSLFLGLAVPALGISDNELYVGMWRGVFWHKNYLGSSMALGYITCLVILFSFGQVFTRLQKSLALLLLVLCAALAVLSGSASGPIMIVLQSGLFIVLFCWLKWGHLVSRRAYWFAAGFLVLGVVLAFSNLGFIFGLFNRSSNMTGRGPMWLHLLDTYIAQRPLLGYGFGAFWLQQDMMQKVQAAVLWAYPVRFADNGYLDVLLGLGGVGLLMLLGLLLTAFWRVARGVLRQRDLVSAFPVFVLVHILVINISQSYFFENEFFIWFLLVLVLFMVSPIRVERAAAEPV